jgi:outer membrane lipoprotein carrier protein
VALLVAPKAPFEGPPASAEPLARRIEERHQGFADLTARFTQTYRSGLLGREVLERGVLSLKRPGRMRWEYREPERKLFVLNGKTSYFYVPADRQVIVREETDVRSLTSLLLAGRGDILARFAVTVEAETATGARLRLVPRDADPEVRQALLDVDASARIRALEFQDAQGNRSQFAFDDIRENVGLSDRMFEFEIPKGVEVITG